MNRSFGPFVAHLVFNLIQNNNIRDVQINTYYELIFMFKSISILFCAFAIRYNCKIELSTMFALALAMTLCHLKCVTSSISNGTVPSIEYEIRQIHVFYYSIFGHHLWTYIVPTHWRSPFFICSLFLDNAFRSAWNQHSHFAPEPQPIPLIQNSSN